MTYFDAVKQNLAFADMIWNMLTADLSDADLFVRPVPEANHLAWQLGHVIVAEWQFLKALGRTAPKLPDGFIENHNTPGAKKDGPDGFLTLNGYRDLMRSMREWFLRAVDEMTEQDLSKPTEGPIAAIAPTVGQLLILAGNHNSFHTGQLSVIRRKLGKPVMF